MIPPPEQRLQQRPLAGTYTIKFVENGPKVPVLLECVDKASDKWSATIGGNLIRVTTTIHKVDVEDDGPPALYTGDQIEGFVFAHMMSEPVKPQSAALFARIVSGGHVISRREYDRLLRHAAHWRRVFPQHPMLHWFEPINLAKIPSLGRLPPPPREDPNV